MALPPAKAPQAPRESAPQAPHSAAGPAGLAAPPDVAFVVHSAGVSEEGGRPARGSKVTPLEAGEEPPEWALRDFAFAAYSGGAAGAGAAARGQLREVHFGRRSLWAFASPRRNCEEVVIFRRGNDTRRRWDGDALHEPKVGLDMFFVMRAGQITADTPLSKQFNGEWGFWESFFAPIVGDGESSLEALTRLDPAGCEGHFALERLPVTCHPCPDGCEVLKIPEGLVVRYEVKASFKDVKRWGEFCNTIGEDMFLQSTCVADGGVTLQTGSECVRAESEMDGVLDGARLKKKHIESLKLPVEAAFHRDMQVAAEWRPDTRHLQRKFDVLGQAYETNLLNGFSALGRLRPDPWHPKARLAVNALYKVLARHPVIRSVLDVGCGDMAWMQYFLLDHPELTYVGVDILPYCLAVNFRRFPKMHFIQTDLSNVRGIEVMPQGCDLVIAKDVFNHMVMPDAVDALRRVVSTQPRFLLTHVHAAADNTGWEKRIDEHLAYTPYDYNKPPFCMPYPATDVQRISEEAYFVLYQIAPDLSEGRAAVACTPRIESLGLPVVDGEVLESFVTVADGEWTEPEGPWAVPAGEGGEATPARPADELGPRPAPAGGAAAAERAENPQEAPKPIKGIPAAEFRARCDLIFNKFDKDKDDGLNFEELVALMDAGGRRIEEYDAYAGLCGRLGCDARVGLARKNVYKLFEKAPQSVWEEVYRSINPLAQMVKKGADMLPETFLERPLSNFVFEDDEQTAKLVIDINEHLFFGAADVVEPSHIQAFFGKQRLEVHIVAPGSYQAKDFYRWRLAVTPLSGEVVPEDCALEVKEATEKNGMRHRKIVIKLMKSKKKKWAKVGQALTGQRI